MLQKWLVFLVIIAATCMEIVRAQERDSIFLYKGQLLLGDIKGGKLGYVTIDDADLGILNVKMYKIRFLKTSNRFRVETSSKDFYYGILQKSPRDGWVDIRLDDSSIVEAEIMSLNQILSLEKRFLTRLDGNFSAGFSYTKSNARGQLSYSSTLRYSGERFVNQLSLSGIGTLDSSTYSRDREDGELFTTYNMDATWFLAAGFNYQRNLELSIARRFSEMIGGGNKLVVSKNFQLRAISGLSFNQEKSTAGEASGLLLEVPLVFLFNYFKYQKPNLQISSSQTIYYSITQKNRFRFDGYVNFSWELFWHFYLTLSPYASYDSKPPEGNSNVDYGSAINITFKF
jgi:hypothetical protein